MSIYYVVRLFVEGERSGDKHYLKLMNCMDPACPFHPSARKGYPSDADHFLWEEEAEKMLRSVMDETEAVERFKIKSGQVHHVEISSNPVGPMLYPGKVPESAPEPVSEPEAVVAPVDTSNPFLEQGEAVLAAGEACDLGDDSDHDAYHEAATWFYENARELLDVVRIRDEIQAELIEVKRERDRLNWLRMNPTSCRAKKNCQEPRKEGFIFCQTCLESGDGGYFDAYQRHYNVIYNDELDKLLAPLRGRLGAISPSSESDHPRSSE